MRENLIQCLSHVNPYKIFCHSSNKSGNKGARATGIKSYLGRLHDKKIHSPNYGAVHKERPPRSIRSRTPTTRIHRTSLSTAIRSLCTLGVLCIPRKKKEIQIIALYMRLLYFHVNKSMLQQHSFIQVQHQRKLCWQE